MDIFDLDSETSIGVVQSVDTANVSICVKDSKQLTTLQVNQLLVIRSSKISQYLIALVSKIMRKYSIIEGKDADEPIAPCDLIKATLIGTFLTIDGTQPNVFKRTLESVPEIDSQCFVIKDKMLTNFMNVLSSKNSKSEIPLEIGKYSLNDSAIAYLDGNKFFQRHAVIVGSTGSGKSYTVATIIEQIAKLKSANALLFDIHGEYEPITGEGIHHYKIAGPSDNISNEIMFLPYWLLTYDEMISMMLDRTDNNAPNEAMAFNKAVINAKKQKLEEQNRNDLLHNFTIDSPIPYDIKSVINDLKKLNTEMVPGSNKREKQGPLNSKLTRFIQRLSNKTSDKRLNFMFNEDNNILNYDYMNDLCKKLMEPASNGGGVKIIDFSEVPSDILPLMVSLLARIIFLVQQWTDSEKRNPIALFCDEAHLYIPQNAQQGIEISSLQSFGRIAKEGRKYGVSLVTISQRPSEVDRTVLSQSNNFIAMRLTNADDQNVIKRLLPDNMGNYADLLPVLGIGEALIVGDSCLLPSRIKIKKPEKAPNGSTIDFWDKWSNATAFNSIDEAIKSIRRQSKE